MTKALLDSRNLGPKTVAWLAAIDIATPAELSRRGAVEVYLALLDHTDAPENLNLLWALEGAILDRDFVDIARHERERLLTELAAAREWHDIE